ncbi:MAG: 4'-phosphopantetheinyl transferase family protein [Chitinophagales bacterium]
MLRSFSILYIYKMPLLLKRTAAEQTQLGIWKIEESADWFRSQLMLDERENALIDSIHHPQKKLHWLSSRLLLRLLLGNPSVFIHLESDERGKPVVHNFPVNLSISHSFDLSVLLLSEKFNTGVDIEKIDKKIERIKQKFLRSDELSSISDNHRLEHLFTLWCAKEAMYKWYGKRQLDFRENLFVNPFQFTPAGNIKGIIRKNSFEKELNISFEKLDSYIMAYTIGTED